jgi:hypothetical protein
MDTIVLGKLLMGAGLGALGGFFLARVRPCSSGACRGRVQLIYSMIGGAVFGAAVAYYFAK